MKKSVVIMRLFIKKARIKVVHAETKKKNIDALGWK